MNHWYVVKKNGHTAREEVISKHRKYGTALIRAHNNNRHGISPCVVKKADEIPPDAVWLCDEEG